MKTQDAIDYYETKAALARALKLTRGAITPWVEAGRLPKGRACELQLITGGQLKVDLSLYEDEQPESAA